MANILKKYNCFDCLQNINEAEHTLEELEAHIAGIHLGFYPYKCIDCLKMFPTKNLLTRHVPQSHHKNSFPVYYECTEEFRKMENELAAKIRKCISLKDEPAMYHPTVMLHSPHIDKPEPFGKLRRMLMKDYTSDGKQQEHLQCKLCDEIGIPL
ncbi:Protein CBG28117 [Caenorhabditis briggsae]|uniref:Protein CBG28117 n=1 Tax=Caenorhabditis briggsae TaxID=6238 RepID=B6IGV6_CAEBR|nr:Protein CBG28117 [Caenorhabditis briggsae]CAR99136.1 Protein CBG28117 [Caenorhabditis briggsae]